MDLTNDDTASTTVDSSGVHTFNQFESALFACMDEVSLLLPGLAERYDVLVVSSALAEHIGAAVQILVKRQVCDTRRARLLIKRIEGIALLRIVGWCVLQNKPVSRQDQIGKCAAEISAALPALVDRHTVLVVVAALTEHLGGALFVSQEANVCSAAQARAIIRRVRQIAFCDSR
jgi:hypothetical protein